MNSRFEHLEFESLEAVPAGQRVESANQHRDYFEEAKNAFEAEAFADALRLFSRVLEFERESQGSWLGQIHCLLQLDRIEEATNWANHALEPFPNNSDIIALKSVALARRGQIAEALAHSDRALRSESPSFLPWLSRAEILVIQGDPSAEYCEERAWNITEQTWQSGWLTSRMRFLHKQKAQALKWALLAVEKAPIHATPWLQAARCQAELNLIPQARDSIARAHELSPDSRSIHLLRQELEKPKGLHGILRGLGIGKR